MTDTDLEAAARRIVERLRNDVCLLSKLGWQEHVALANEAADRIAALEEQFSAAETSAIMWKARCEQAERQLAEARRALHLADQWLCWFLEGDEFDKTYLEEDRAMILAALAPAEKPGSNEEDIR